MLSMRFYVSWLLASIFMFGLSFFWHGVLLTDFSRISYPKGIFLVSAGVVYFALGFLINKVYQLKFFKTKYKAKPVLRGFLVGASCGILLYMIALVFGISFNSNLTLKNIAIDLSWQILEQGFGGLIVGASYIFIYDEEFDLD